MRRLHLENCGGEPVRKICLSVADTFLFHADAAPKLLQRPGDHEHCQSAPQAAPPCQVFVGEVERIDLPKQAVVISHGHA